MTQSRVLVFIRLCILVVALSRPTPIDARRATARQHAPPQIKSKKPYTKLHDGHRCKTASKGEERSMPLCTAACTNDVTCHFINYHGKTCTLVKARVCTLETAKGSAVWSPLAPIGVSKVRARVFQDWYVCVCVYVVCVCGIYGVRACVRARVCV